MNSTLKVCSVCGKQFIPAVSHIYQTRKRSADGEVRLLQCSYTCYRKAKAETSNKQHK